MSSASVGWAPPFLARHYAEIDSTNEEARRLYTAGDLGALWVVTDRQTAGRGRRGRAWSAGGQDLTTSYLLTTRHPGLTLGDGRPRRSLAEAATLTFAASLAVREVLLGAALGADVRLKWPNDVLIGCETSCPEGDLNASAKVCGILLEAFGTPGDYGIAIGIGLNLASHPPTPEPGAWPAASLLSATGATLSRDVALERLATAFDRRIDQWLAQGFAALRPDWLAAAARLGEVIEVRLVNETLSGRFCDVDGEGALVLDTATGTRHITAAEVFFPETRSS
ncbi:MAG: biotin--[acetyl-CoA-carboxylase] ligase [Pseudomonadota bacterium]